MAHCPNRAAQQAFDAGHYGVAVARLRAINNRTDEDDLLLAECLAATGPYAEALAFASKFQTSANLVTKARATRVRAEVASLTGPTGDAIALYEEAVALATEAEAPDLSCAIRLDYLRAMVSAGLDFPQNESFERLKADVLRLARPDLLAAFHIHACTFQALHGNLSLATAHGSLAKAHLRSAPNASRQAGLLMAQAVIATVETDVQPGIELAEKAWDLAQRSGRLWNQFAALGSMAYWQLREGRFKDARATLARAAKFSSGSPTAEAAVLETRAQVALAERQYSECEELLARARERFSCDSAISRSWYRLSTFQTEIRLAAATGEWSKIAGVSRTALTLARDRHDKFFEAVFGCYLAESSLMQGEHEGSTVFLRAALLCVATPPPALRLNLYRVIALYLNVKGLHKEALESLTIAYETARGMSDAIASSEIEQTADRLRMRIHPIHSYQASRSVTDLSEFLDQPQVVAERLFRSLRCGQGFEGLALYRSAPGALEVADSVGLTADDVRKIIKEPRPDFENIVVGDSGSHTYALLVSTPTTVEGARELMTARRLAAAAIALQKARDEAKSRESIWTDREVAVASGGIYLAPAMLELLDTARRIAPLNVPVLLTGETGVGKEVVARTIHESSNRAAKPFIPFNCSAVPRDMVESQLFGYRRGAFTGAHENFSGIIRAASGGTVFLDEIGDLPLDIQPKLLRFLETAEVHPLGEPEPVKVEVRVIAATNVDLEALVAQGRFRTDLYYRLNVVPLTVPPLRERREEVPALATLYLRRYAEEFDRGVLTFAPETLEMLVTYKWPGNVRQLANEIRRVAALARADSAITPAMLSRDIVKTTAASLPARPAAPVEPAKLPISLDQALGEAVASLEAAMIRRALAKAGGHVDEAAAMLGLSRKGLFLKRRRLGIAAPES